MTDKTKKLKEEAFKALSCLLHESIAEDVRKKVETLVVALEIELEIADTQDKKMDIILKALKK